MISTKIIMTKIWHISLKVTSVYWSPNTLAECFNPTVPSIQQWMGLVNSKESLICRIILFRFVVIVVVALQYYTIAF